MEIEIGLGDNPKTARIVWMYPNIYPEEKTLDSITISLCHVRAVSNIKIEFDGNRNGYVIKMDKIKDMGEYIEVVKEDDEVAFIPAWNEEECNPPKQ